MKRTLVLASLVVGLLYGTVASAQDARTQWTPIAQSMTVLLNEGWRIISHGNSKAVTESYATQANSLTELYSFVLAKESKMVICLIYDPQPNNAISRCRALN